jgi:hypothetical protein
MSPQHEGKAVSNESKCSCQHCSGNISFPTEMAGQIITCPHCGMETKLYVPAIPKNVRVEIKRGASPLGIASLVLGIIACIFCWIPLLGLLVLPLALIGLLLAGVGIIMAGVNKKTGFVFPVSGLIVCLLSGFIAIAITGSVAAIFAHGKQTNQEQVSNSGQQVTSSPAENWSKSSIVKQGDIKVAIKRVSLPNETPAIQIELSVANLSTTKKVDFTGWSGVELGIDASSASLTDNNQNNYKRITDGMAPDNTIYPQQEATDTISFETPVENIQWLHLELPAKNFGGSGMLRFEFSIDKIKAAREGVRKAQVDFDSFHANPPYLTNADYVKITNDKNTIISQRKTLEESQQAAAHEYIKVTYSGNMTLNYSQAPYWKNIIDNDNTKLSAEVTQLNQIDSQLSKITQDATAIASSKLEAAKSILADAETNLNASLQ